MCWCSGVLLCAGDLSQGWSILDPATHIYRKDRYSACPTLRWYRGYFYLITLYGEWLHSSNPALNSLTSVLAAVHCRILGMW